MKRLARIILLPLDGMPVHFRITPSIKFAGFHLYTWVRHCESKLPCPRTQHNVSSQGTNPDEPGPLDPEVSALTTRPPRLSWIWTTVILEGGLDKGSDDVRPDVNSDVANFLNLNNSFLNMNNSCMARVKLRCLAGYDEG